VKVSALGGKVKALLRAIFVCLILIVGSIVGLVIRQVSRPAPQAVNTTVMPWERDWSGDQPSQTAPSQASQRSQKELMPWEMDWSGSTPEEAKLDASHPGWRDTVRTVEFRAWLAQQPPSLQALTESERAVDAMFVLDLYSISRPR